MYYGVTAPEIKVVHYITKLNERPLVSNGCFFTGIALGWHWIDLTGRLGFGWLGLRYAGFGFGRLEPSITHGHQCTTAEIINVTYRIFPV
jgi:hypothetical protein